MLGATMSDVTAGLPALLSNVADEDRQNLSEYIRSLGDAGPEAPFDFRVLRPSGSVAWLRQHAPLEGHPSAGDKTAVVTDVTDEVTAARRLVFSEASLASVQDAHLGTWRVDMATRTLGVSTELRGWFGSDIRDVPGFIRYARGAVHPSDLDEVLRCVQAVLDGGAAPPTLFRVRTTEGGWRYVRQVGSRVITSDTGDVECVVGAMQDVTWTEQRMERSERLLQRAVDGGGLGLWEWNPQTGHAAYNTAWADMLGYSLSELPADMSLWRSSIHPADRRRVLQVFDDHLRSGEARVRVTYRLKRRDDTYRHVLSTVLVTERDARGAVSRLTGAHMDVTELMEANEARERLESQLARTQRMESLGQLAGGIAHDFNNLLQVISAYSELAETGGPEERDRGLQDIRKAAMGASALTRQLLAFSRSEPRTSVLVDLSARVRDIAPMLRRVLDNHYRFTVTTPRVERVSVDPNLFDQAVLNLVINARDAMPRGGEIRLESALVDLASGDPRRPPGHAAGTHVVVSVVDQGVGIAPPDLEHVFAPFFTTKAAGKGTGLGLAMVYGFATQHGGFVRATSELGHGATFEVWIPVRVDAEGTSEAGADVAVPLGKGETVLVADDDKAVRHVMQRTLERGGYKVLCAADGLEAVALWQEHHADVGVVILDLVMPHAGAHEVLAEMLKVRAPARVMVVSGYLGSALNDELEMPVPTVTMSKPWQRDHLLGTVRRLLDSDD
ncbi:MAG: PAS domain-containing protein [Polyangiales bacterium]